MKKVFINLLCCLFVSIANVGAEPNSFSVSYRKLVLEQLRDSVYRALYTDNILVQAVSVEDLDNLSRNAVQKPLFDMAQARRAMLENLQEVIKSLGGTIPDLEKIQSESSDIADEILKNAK